MRLAIRKVGVLLGIFLALTAWGGTGAFPRWEEPPVLLAELHPVRTPTLSRTGTYELRLRSVDGKAHRLLVRWRSNRSLRAFPETQQLYLPAGEIVSVRVSASVHRSGDHALIADLFLLEGKERYLLRVGRFLRVTESGVQESALPFPRDPTWIPPLERTLLRGRMAAPGEPMSLSGTLVYFDDLIGEELPVRRATVELREILPAGNFQIETTVQTTETDAQGRFRFLDVPTVAEDGSPRRYRIVASLNNSLLLVMDRFGRTYAVGTDEIVAAPGSFEYRLRWGPEDPGYMAAHVFLTVLDAAEFLERELGFVRRKLPVEYPTGRGATFYQWSSRNGEINAEVIYILFDHTGRREPVLHEYGHAVATAVYGYNSHALPQPQYQGPHSFHTVSDEGFALQEGWAEWFAALVDDSALNAKSYTNADLPNIETNAWWTGRIEGNGSNRRGEIVEGAVASVLWDLVDTPLSLDTTPGEDDDPIVGMLPTLWGLFEELRPQTILTVRDVWYERRLPQWWEVLEIFATHGMALEGIAPPEYRFTVSLHAGPNLLHVPLKVEGLLRMSDLYEVLGGAETVNALIALNSEGKFQAYTGGEANDLALEDGPAVIAVMKQAREVTFVGTALPAQVPIRRGLNLIGVPLTGGISMLSQLKALSDRIALIVYEQGGRFRAYPPLETSVVGGKAYLIVATGDALLNFSGLPWGEEP
ncbi:MAG: hypothetical protein KatS3mg115_1461 [Candidatus Poribacteria bacterium]|nr:MAG: hypothetical protein KatS3mg115_1461 [Candidatus Poribacteria bacterium]